MKKQYLEPVTSLLAIKTGSLLVGASTTQIEVHTDEEVNDPDDLLTRRRRDIWNDEEEDIEDMY